MVELEQMIEVHHLSKAYTKRKTKEVIHAVDDVSFQVSRGEVVGLLGPNGAGKSSTIKLICGMIYPDQGHVLINGIHVQKERLSALRHISAVLEGNRNLYWRLTAQENMEYFAGNRGYKRKEVSAQIDRLLHQFGLEGKRHEVVHSLSRGMQQKLAIAVALLANSELILLDEPTLGLDVETSYEVREMLKTIAKEEHGTIIISSHDMPVIQELCDRVIIINNGAVVVDERVDNLIKVFQKRAYSIEIGHPLSDTQEKQLISAFPLCSYSVEAGRCRIEVNLEQSKDIYKLMDILKLEETLIENIERKTVDFENVFLQIVKGEKMHA